MQAQNEWKAAVSAEDTFACLNKYFFDFKIDCGDSSLNIPIGDRDGTATKLLILFQELFLNAVKYSSFTEREKRFVKLDIAITPENWNIKISNSAAGRSNAKSSGIGLAVIKNFAALFEAKYDASLKNDVYTTNINFFLNK
jgi:two-component sensor histidine kinase